ncbi:MAG: elongation factor G [Bacillota bacterium]|nr:elongation factor G [Bacillota bacterium]
MKKIGSERIRNIALVSHGGAGKTSLVEAALFLSGATTRMGRVEEGTTVTDHDPEEVKRQISISTALAPVEWEECKLNFLDTPGYFDFVGEVASALRVADAALVVVEAVSGVEVGTEKVMGYAAGLPKLIFVSKMDRENANFQRVLTQLRQKFGNRVVPAQLPLGTFDSFRGVIDLIAMKAQYTEGGKVREAEIPAELAGEAQALREMLIEEVAATDDDLTLKFLEGEVLTEQELAEGLAKGTAAGKVIPVFAGAATKSIGVTQLLQACVRYLPSPAAVAPAVGKSPRGEEVSLSADPAGSLAALVFKTMADPFVGKLTLLRVYSGTLKSDSHAWNANKGVDERIGQLVFLRGKEQLSTPEVVAGDIGAVAKLGETQTGHTLCDKDKAVILPGIDFPKPVVTLAVEPKAKGDEDKISSGLNRLAEEDPTIAVEKNTETGQLLVKGLGELHVEVITSRLQKKFGVAVDLSTPKVPYKETIRGTAKAEYKHKKQTGGRGQYGHCIIELEPLPQGGGFEFVDKIFGGAVPKQYIPAVEKGIRETMEEGVIAGYPVVDVRVSLLDGSYHSVDSSEMAFKIASSMAFKKGFQEAKPILLEPVMRVEVTVPDDYMGDIMGDLNKKRGKILGMEPVDGVQVIKALVPLAEMFKYAIDLRSMTQGRGAFAMEFDHYEEVPAHLAEQIIAAAKKEREKGE